MEQARTQPRLGDNCRIVTVTVDLVNDPRNLRAERQRKARAQQRQAAARRRKRLRTLCGWLSFLSFVAAYGYVAWIEGGGDLLRGTIYAFISIGLFALFGTLNGAMVW